MTPPTEQEVEAALMNAAHATLYPPTPDIASAVMRRLHRRSPVPAVLARAALILIALFIAAFVAVPEIRAAVLSILRIGAVIIVRETPTPDPRPDNAAAVLLLENETTLEAAREAMPFEIRLPTFPSDLGQPDRVYVPTDQSVALLWMAGDRPRLVLTIHGPGEHYVKYYPHEESGVFVGRSLGMWLTQPHVLYADRGDEVARRIINSHVLVWTLGTITYRLETDLVLDDALRIAESIE